MSYFQSLSGMGGGGCSITKICEGNTLFGNGFMPVWKGLVNLLNKKITNINYKITLKMKKVKNGLRIADLDSYGSKS